MFREINRDFPQRRGVDGTHAPEFTMVEAYGAYGNYDTIAALVKRNSCRRPRKTCSAALTVTLLDLARNTTWVASGDDEHVRLAVRSLARRSCRTVVPTTRARPSRELGRIADKLGVERDDVENHGKLVEHLWEHFYEDKAV